MKKAQIVQKKRSCLRLFILKLTCEVELFMLEILLGHAQHIA